MLKDVFRKVYGNGVVLVNLRGQRRTPYLPEEELRARRDERLRRTVRYAVETVPYYRSLFQREGIYPRDIETVEDLERLPLIDKQMVRKDPDQFVSTSPRGRNSIEFLTSGSMGMPLRVYHDCRSLLANIAFGERERAVVSRICGHGLKYNEIFIGYPGSTIHKVWGLYRQMTYTPVRPQRLTLSLLEPFDRVVEAINQFRPDLLVSYGSYLEILFKLLASGAIRMHLPRAVLYGADAMTVQGRTLIEEQFGVAVISQYNAVECFKIGFTCEAGSDFHIHEDLCPVRIVDDSGRRVASGGKGEVVISNLVNRGTVLLNYRLGDIASMPGRRCACGRSLPILSGLEGRVEDVIFLANGAIVHPRAVWGVFKGRQEVLRYQLIQHAPERFDLKLVTTDEHAYQRIIDSILGDLHALLGKAVRIDSGYYQELETQPAGKFRAVISLCKRQGFI